MTMMRTSEENKRIKREMASTYVCRYAAALLLCSSYAISKKSCDISLRIHQKTCIGKWKYIRLLLHPSQQAVGFAAVKRKLDADFATKGDAEETMKNKPLLYVMGPNNVPFLIDAHHTARALDESGFDNTQITLEMVCDWSWMNSTTSFYDAMIANNFMEPLGRASSNIHGELPIRIDPSTNIPDTIAGTVDDPWRSFATLVRKVKHKKRCPKGHSDCLRGYFRQCEGNGHLTPFFEFRWAYFFQDAFIRGCTNDTKTLWDSMEDCKNFHDAFVELPTSPITDVDLLPWKKAADLLIPLCRGKKAGEYVLPNHLGIPYGGKKLPGYVAGKHTQILEKDPDCLSPKCPDIILQSFTTITESNKFLRHNITIGI